MGLFSKLFSSKKENILGKNFGTVTYGESMGMSDEDIIPLQGEYAKAVFLWAHSKDSVIKKSDEYARYFLHECGIRDAAKYHRELIDEGYFEEASIETKLSTLKVVELKQILDSIGQSVTGKKEQLIDRIIKNADERDLSDFFKNQIYQLSSKGIDFLETHNDCVLVHKHSIWGVDWKEYESRRKPGYSYYDTMWGIFNERALHSNNWGRNEYYYMYQLLVEEGKRELALGKILQVLYIDLSGVCGIEAFKLFRSGAYGKKDLKEFFGVAISLAPGIVKAVSEYSDIYEDSFVDRVYAQKLPIQICQKKLFLQIVHSILDGTYDETTVVEKLKKEYYAFINKL